MQDRRACAHDPDPAQFQGAGAVFRQFRPAVVEYGQLQEGGGAPGGGTAADHGRQPAGHGADSGREAGVAQGGEEFADPDGPGRQADAADGDDRVQEQGHEGGGPGRRAAEDLPHAPAHGGELGQLREDPRTFAVRGTGCGDRARPRQCLDQAAGGRELDLLVAGDAGTGVAGEGPQQEHQQRNAREEGERRPHVDDEECGHRSDRGQQRGDGVRDGGRYLPGLGGVCGQPRCGFAGRVAGRVVRGRPQQPGEPEPAQPGGGTAVHLAGQPRGGGVQRHFGRDDRGAPQRPDGARRVSAEQQVEGVAEDGGFGEGCHGGRHRASENGGGAPATVPGRCHERPVGAAAHGRLLRRVERLVRGLIGECLQEWGAGPGGEPPGPEVTWVSDRS